MVAVVPSLDDDTLLLLFKFTEEQSALLYLKGMPDIKSL